MTNKPEVLGYCAKKDRGPWERSNSYYLSPNPDMNYTVPVISLSDYEALQTECRRLLSAAAYSMVHNPVCQREAHGPCMCRDCVLAQIGPFVASIQEAEPDVTALVEALEAIQKAATHKNIHTGIQAGTALGCIAAICDITLAAHRKQEGKV